MICGKVVLHKHNAQLIYNLANCMNYISISNISLNKKSLKDFANIISYEIIGHHFTFLWYIAILYNSKFKLDKPELPNVTKK